MVVGDGNNARLEEVFYPSLNRYVIMYVAMMKKLMVLGELHLLL